MPQIWLRPYMTGTMGNRGCRVKGLRAASVEHDNFMEGFPAGSVDALIRISRCRADGSRIIAKARG
jgi:hypothetical protein